MLPWEDSPRPPRRWQAECLPLIGNALREGIRPIVRAATGSGKAQLISEMCALLARPGEVIIVVAPRQSLVEQLSGLEGEDDYRAGSIAWRMGPERVGVFYGRRKLIDGRDVIATCTPSMGALAVELAARGAKVRALIVDEAHRSECAAMIGAVNAMAPRYTIGFTATPWRSDKGESLSLFDREVYTYGIGAAIGDGVLVGWDTIGWDVDGRGDPGADDACAEMIREHGIGPGIVSARTIADAEVYADFLAERGIAALAIHSKMPTAERRSRIARLLAGEVRCLVHVALMSEGTDIPELRWICMRRHSATAIRFVQELGRVLRTSPGKGRALLLDPFDHEGEIGIQHDSAIGRALDDAIDAESDRECSCSGCDAHEGECGATFQGPEDGPSKCPRCRARGPGEAAEMPPLVAVSEITRYARNVVMLLVEAGLIEESLKGGRWRAGFPSPRQVETLRQVGGVEARAVLPHLDKLNRGEVSDLLGYLFAVRRLRREGRTLPPLPPLPSAAISALESRR